MTEIKETIQRNGGTGRNDKIGSWNEMTRKNKMILRKEMTAGN